MLSLSGLLTFLLGDLVLAVILYVVHLVIDMLTLPANIKQIALIIVGLIGLVLLFMLAFGGGGISMH
jgi:hypothetical protein